MRRQRVTGTLVPRRGVCTGTPYSKRCTGRAGPRCLGGQTGGETEGPTEGVTAWCAEEQAMSGGEQGLQGLGGRAEQYAYPP